MAVNTPTIPVRDFTTGAGRSGLEVKLYHKVDNNWVLFQESSGEVSGYPGVYQFANVPYKKYKLWINGAEYGAWGGPDGKEFGGGDFDAALIISGVFDILRIPDLPQEKITGLVAALTELTNALADKASKTAGNEWSGANIITGQRWNRDDGIATGDFATPTDMVFLDDVQEMLANLSGGVTYYAQMEVVPQLADNPGKQYNTILKAVNALVAIYGAPSALKPYRIIVRNNEVNKNYITAAAGTIRNYIHIIGVDQSIMLNPADTNITADTRLENLSLLLTTGQGNRIFSSLNYLRVLVYAFNNYTHKGGTVELSRFGLASGKTLTFDKTTGTDYADVVFCSSNVEAQFTDGENYIYGRNCVTQGMKLIADPTSN
jgi:hypothetical protein